MKVFIFGAGASKGSQTTPNLPGELIAPLTNDLFNHSYESYNNLISRDDLEECRNAAIKAGSLETWLTEKWSSISNLTQDSTRQAEIAFFGNLVFFIWKILLNISNTYNTQNAYSLFLKKLKNEDKRFGLISFNYDTLLDKAIEERFSSPMKVIDDYLSLNYVKPHGSVNWFLGMRTSDPRIPGHQRKDINLRIKVAAANMLKGTHNIEGLILYPPSHSSLGNVGELFKLSGHDYLYPLMFAPLTMKLYNQIEGFVEKIIEKGKQLISEADDIYLVGYKANDEIIKDLLNSAKKNALIHIIGTTSAQTVADSLCKWIRKDLTVAYIYQEGFSNFVNNFDKVEASIERGFRAIFRKGSGYSG